MNYLHDFNAFSRQNEHTQLTYVTSIDGDIDDHQVLKYQPSFTSRLRFHHLIPLTLSIMGQGKNEANRVSLTDSPMECAMHQIRRRQRLAVHSIA